MENKGNIYKKLKAAKKKLRAKQREMAAMKRNEVIDDIMSASSNDAQLFSKLVRNQRKVVTTITDKIIFNDEEVEGPQMLESWADFFRRLATPKDNDEFDDNY